MNKFFINLATIFLITTTPLVHSAQPHYRTHHNPAQFASVTPQAKQAVNALYRLPEFREMLAKVQQEGPIHLRMASNLDFEGLWDANARHIVINTRSRPYLGSVINTILFELHNAATTRYYDHLIDLAQSGKLSKDQYVEKVERAEYENVKKTHLLLEKGIRMGIFPESARWPVISNFEDHYKIQQVSGHSLFIADSYNEINPRGRYEKYIGTIHRPAWLNDQDRDELCRYIMMRSGLESLDAQMMTRFRYDLKQEVAFLKNGYHKIGAPQHIQRNPRRIALMKIALNGNKEFHEETKDLHFFA